MKPLSQLIIVCVLVLGAVATAASPVFAGVFDPEIQKVNDAVGQAFIRQAVAFVKALNSTGATTLEITETFYDARYHRVFVSVRGEALLSQGLARLLGSRDRLFEGNGLLAYDLAITEMQQSGGKVRCQVEGDLIIFQEQLIRNLAEVTPILRRAYGPAAQTVLLFLEKLDARAVATAVAATITDFSPEKLDELNKELAGRVKAMGDTPLKRLLAIAQGTGELARFFLFSLVKGLPGMVAGNVGGTLGAMIGTMLVPGAGSVIGGYIGGVIVSQAIQAKLHALPIELEIGKIKRYGRLQDEAPDSSLVDRRYEKARGKLRELVSRDLEKNSYVAVDVVIAVLKKDKASDGPALTAVAADLRQILTFRLHQEGDRYAERKLQQIP